MSTMLRATLTTTVTGLMLGLAGPANAIGCDGEYTVRAGDTLSRIAAECGTSIDTLLEANPRIVSPSSLSIGWTLEIPGAEAGAGEELAAIPEPQGPVSLQGWIVNGHRCAMLATEDGEEYGVVSPDLSFVSGRAVAVEGRIVDDPSCAAKTVLVTELSTTDL